MTTSHILGLFLRRKGKVSFLAGLKPDARILDVGCGNDSPHQFKRILPHCDYTGIDIGDYEQTKPNLADRYLIVKPDTFSGEIAKLSNSFDAVVSSHNLEHCNDRAGTLTAMLKSLRPDGLIYLSFPCEDSTNFPRRGGSLNYFDDPTHKDAPPLFDNIVAELESSGFQMVYAKKRFRPKVLWLLGLLVEPISARKRKVLKGTWEYWGFESIIWAKKVSAK